MLSLLRHHFGDSPARRKVALALYSRGISVKNGKLLSNSIEISPSQVARTLKVNRKTVYDTIKQIQEDPELSVVMANIYPEVSSVSVAPMVGSQVIIIYMNRGCHKRIFDEFFDKLKAYHAYMNEIVSKTVNNNQRFIRVILQTKVPETILKEFDEIKGISRVVVLGPEPGSDTVLCGTCRSSLFPENMASPLISEVDKANPLSE